MNLSFDEPLTEAEKRAHAILKDAKIETDDDYRRLALLIDEAVHDLVDEHGEDSSQ